MKILNKLLKSEFIVAISTTSFTTAIQMITGLVINKILAITVGPSGIALIGQFVNFKELATNLANGSFGQGVTKYIADPNVESKKVIVTSNIFTLFLSLVIGLLSVVFSGIISEFLFKSRDYYYVIVIFGVALPLFAFNNLLISTVNGYRDFKTLAKLKLIPSLVSLVLSGLLTWYFMLKGSLIAQAVNTSIVLLLSVFFVNRVQNYIYFDYKYFDKSILKSLLVFTLMALTSAQLKPLVQLFIRNYIIVHSNEHLAGLWDATKKLSESYTQIIIVSLSAYYLPKLSSLQTKILLKNEIFRGFKTILPLFFLMAISIYFFRDIIIRVVYSSDFLYIKDLIFPQLVGDFFMIISFLVGYLLIAKAMVKTFMVLQIIMALTRILFSMLFFNYLGVLGVLWANALNYLIYSIIVIFIFRNILFAKS